MQGPGIRRDAKFAGSLGHINSKPCGAPTHPLKIFDCVAR